MKFFKNTPCLFFCQRSFALIVTMVIVIGTGKSATTAYAEEHPICDLCDRSVIGRYQVYTLDGADQVVCRRCLRTRERCGICSIPMKRYASEVGKAKVCNRCAPNALTCSLCDQLIRGAYTTYSLDDNQLHVCSTCQRIAPKCHACRRPVRSDESTRSGSRVLCKTCNHTLRKCSACDLKILGSRV